MTLRDSLFNALPYLTALLLTIAFVYLGRWQLDRAAQKDALLSAYDAALAQPAILANDLADMDDYSPVRVRGAWTQGPQIWLENQILDQRAGFHVYQLFTPERGLPILINRGWVERDRRAVPEASGEDTLAGLLVPPPGVGVQLGEVDFNQGGSRVVTPYLDLASLEAMLETPVHDRVLLQTSQSPAFERRWRPQVSPPERHLGYAVQWFALAAAVVTITAVLAWRKHRRKPS